MIGFILLIISTIIICGLLNLLKPSKTIISWTAVIASTFVVPVLWHVGGYFIEGPKVLMWFYISLPISMVCSFFTALIVSVVFYLRKKDK